MAWSSSASLISSIRAIFWSTSKIPPDALQSGLQLFEVVSHGGDFNHFFTHFSNQLKVDTVPIFSRGS